MKQTVDILIKGGKLVNVFSGEIYPENIAIRDGKIVGFGNYPAKKIINIKGKYICPGFIEGHIHIESTMVGLGEFARTVCVSGTTSVVADPHEIANVLGLDGIKYMLESAKYQPINLFLTLPSCVPSSLLETSGARLSAFDLYPYLNEHWVVGLGEMMNFPGVLAADPEVLRKIKMGSAKHVDGHAPGLEGKGLDCYIASGIGSEHESTTVKEAREKLRKGMYVMMREGSVTRNLGDLLPLCTPENIRRILFVSDDRHPNDLIKGHLNLLVKKAIKFGVKPVDAVRAVTLNTAECFGLKNIGAIAPGYEADITVVDNPKDFNVNMVFYRGEIVAKNGVFAGRPKNLIVPLRSSVNVKWLSEKDFEIPVKGKKINVIDIVPDQIITKKFLAAVKTENGKAVYDVERDILKLVVVERHQASGQIGKGFVRGVGLKSGAIASSVAHDSHNIIAVGTDDESIFTAVVEVIKMGGGLSAAKGNKILGKLPLPIAGLMSNRPLAEVSGLLETLTKLCSGLGVSLKDPYMALSFLALPVIPELKLTDKGLVDVNRGKVIDLFVR
jgi:adenine deaminase